MGRDLKARTIVAAILLIVFLMESLAIVNLADANPFPLNSAPDLNQPIRVIQSPQNYSIYQSSSVPINITIIEPSTWKKHYTPATDDYVKSVEVFLDGNVTNQLSVGDYEFYLNTLVVGLHTLKIKVLAYSYYAGAFLNGSEATDISYSEMNSNGVYVPHAVYKYPIVSSDTVYFTIQQPIPKNSERATPIFGQPLEAAVAIGSVVIGLSTIVVISVIVKRQKNQQVKKN